MTKAKVYFSDLRAKPGMNLLQKLERLIRTAGIGDIDFEKKKEFYKRKRKEMEEKLTEKTQENIKINQVHQEQEPKKSR